MDPLQQTGQRIRYSLGGYELVKRLDNGGMAEVFVARKRGPHGFVKEVALKRILPQFTTNPEFVSMFIKEARVAARLTHPNVVQIFDFGEDAGELFLAMELVTGSNISHLLDVAKRQSEPVPLPIVLHTISEASRALHYVHNLVDAGGRPLCLVHRDVSPANLLLTKTGHVKLSDFGIVSAARPDSQAVEQTRRGKLGYMSPEQVTGAEVDERSDVFSLAVVMTEMLLAGPLFDAATELEVLLRIRDADLRNLDRRVYEIPEDVERALRAVLVADPRDRPSSEEFVSMVDGLKNRFGGISNGPEQTARYLLKKGLCHSESGEIPVIKSRREKSEPVKSKATKEFDRVGHGQPSYRVKANPQAGDGLINYSSLVELLTSGKLDQHSLVAKQDSDFVEVRRLPELLRFVSTPALQWKESHPVDREFSGTIDGTTLLSVIHQLSVGGKTGVLRLRNAEDRKKIYFVEGQPDFIASNRRQELLGEFLIASGACLRMEVDMALAMLPRYSGRLGDALVGLNVLRPMELFRAVVAQVEEKYLDCFSWSSGFWAFEQGAQSEEETYPMAGNVQSLMLRAARRVDRDALRHALAEHWDQQFQFCQQPFFTWRAYKLPGALEECCATMIEQQASMTLAELAAFLLQQVPELREQVLEFLLVATSCELLNKSS